MRNLLISWTILCRDWTYSLVVVLGLTVGLTAFFLLIDYARVSLNYEDQIPEVDQVYLLKHRMNLLEKPQWTELMPLAFEHAAIQGRKDLIASVFVARPDSVMVNHDVKSVALFAVDPEFIDIFDLRALEGDLHGALVKPDAAVLTLNTARKLFGTDHAVGRQIDIAGQAVTIAAIIADPQANSTVHYDALIGTHAASWPANERRDMMDAWAMLGGKIYLKFKHGTGPAEADRLASTLQDAADRSPFASQLPPEVTHQLGQRKWLDIKVGRLSAAYFDRDVYGSTGSGMRGNLQVVLGAVLIAAVALLMAAMNFVNLTTIRTVGRQREIAIRKVVGSRAATIVTQFIVESVSLSLVATLLALAISGVLLPTFSDLVATPLDLSIDHCLTAIVTGLLVGLLCGIYPAWLALGVRPMQALAGRFANADGLWLRTALTVLQFGAAIGLSAVTLTIAWQTNYANHVKPPFDASHILALRLPETGTPASIGAFRNALVQSPGIAAVAAGMDAIGANQKLVGWEYKITGPDGRTKTILTRDVSANYFETYRITPAAGRLFSADQASGDHAQAVVINAEAATLLGFSAGLAAVGQFVRSDKDGSSRQIIGIVPDLRQNSVHETAQPLMYKVGDFTPMLLISFVGPFAQVRPTIESLWKETFPDQILNMDVEQTLFEQRYAQDRRLTNLLTITTLVTFGLASFGIYVLSAYNVRRKYHEIVIRKLYGARNLSIVGLISRDMLMLILACAIVTLPFAYLVNEQYLSTFAERAPGQGWPLVIALLLTVSVAMLAASRHILRAIRLRPIDAMGR